MASSQTNNRPGTRTSNLAWISFLIGASGILGVIVLIGLRQIIVAFAMIVPGVVALALAGRAKSEIRESRGRIFGKGLANLGTLTGFLCVGLSLWAPMALPGYIRFLDKGKQSEAKQNLGAIWTTQAFYFEQNSRYATSFQELGWDPEYMGPTKYAYFLGADSIQPVKGGPFALPGGISTTMTSEGYTALAVSNIDRDDTLDVWAISENKHLRNLVNDVRE